jgi:hypothetical protein
MERSVKTLFRHSPPSLFNGGVRFQVARAAWLARVQLASAAETWVHAFAIGEVVAQRE